MSRGNTKLVEYGIQNEESDLRAHVCPLAKVVYIYPTASGAEIAQSCLDGTANYPLKQVRTGHIITAEGYIVPWQDIAQIVEINVPDVTWNHLSLDQIGLTTTQKGQRAARLVKDMINRGVFPLSLLQIELDGAEVKDKDIQIQGADIIITIAKQVVVQVKCDLRGGNGCGVNNCTGNLFLQVRECNPFKQY